MKKKMSTEIFLVDTGVWISSFCPSNKTTCVYIRQLLKKLEEKERVVTCGIVLAEFARGLGETKREVEILEILENHEYLETIKEVFVYAGQLSRKLDRKRLKIPLTDCLIAATAIFYGATLVTGDPHFKRFEGLKLEFLG